MKKHQWRIIVAWKIVEEGKERRYFIKEKTTVHFENTAYNKSATYSNAVKKATKHAAKIWEKRN